MILLWLTTLLPLLGALLTILNKANLTPFHVSILAGNTPVTSYFLNRRAKSQDGCHPSKATPDGRTPLQLAIASDNPSMVELMLKDATVHDVERLWEQTSLPYALKKILETKVDSTYLCLKSTLTNDAERIYPFRDTGKWGTHVAESSPKTRNDAKRSC